MKRPQTAKVFRKELDECYEEALEKERTEMGGKVEVIDMENGRGMVLS